MGRKEEVKTNEMLPSVYGKPQITGSITKTFTSGSIKSWNDQKKTNFSPLDAHFSFF